MHCHVDHHSINSTIGLEDSNTANLDNIIMLKLNKTFDKVDHKLLFSKLQKHGFHSQLIKWLESLLSGHS